MWSPYFVLIGATGFGLSCYLYIIYRFFLSDADGDGVKDVTSSDAWDADGDGKISFSEKVIALGIVSCSVLGCLLSFFLFVRQNKELEKTFARLQQLQAQEDRRKAKKKAPAMYLNEVADALAVIDDCVDQADRGQPLTRDINSRLEWLRQAISDGDLYKHKIAADHSKDPKTLQYFAEGILGMSKPASSAASLSNVPRLLRSMSTFGQEFEEKASQVMIAHEFGETFSDECKAYLKNLGRWDFDSFHLDKLSKGRPLQAVMWAACTELGLSGSDAPEYLPSTAQLQRFVQRVEDGYNPNPFHSKIHAADVVQAVFYFLTTGGISDLIDLTLIEKFTILVAAAIHDYDHNGLTNAYLTKTSHHWAILYNDKSVLENRHLAEAYKQVFSVDDCNPYRNLLRESRVIQRKTIIEIVHATDLAHHGQLLAELNNIVDGTILPDFTKQSTRLLVMKIIVKCADISNPARPQEIANKWQERVLQEFYHVGDLERDRGLDVSKFHDRHHPEEVTCQDGFMKYIVGPLYEGLHKLSRVEKLEACDMLRINTAEIARRVADGEK
eukprot:m.12608 g.12608  ORF g.12608 m.12608 type:complete len:556 (-) comp9383_c0_seq1:262-1929(-)